MRTILAALALACAMGCGGDPSQGEQLIGTWLSDVSTTCTFGMNFADKTFFAASICGIGGGAFGTSGEWGSYSLSGSRMDMTTTQATCESERVKIMDTAVFSVAGDTMTLTGSTGAIVFKRFHDMPSSASGAFTFGCFKDGQFTAMAMHPVP